MFTTQVAGTSLIAVALGAAAVAQTPPCMPDDGSSIDLLVVYTPDAQAEAGGPSAIQATIAGMVEGTNQFYVNSAIATQLNLVHTAQLVYDGEGGGDSITQLVHLRGDCDGELDAVHGLRDSYAADMVALIVSESNVCGRGDLGAPRADSAFCVVHLYPLCPEDYVLAHELAHLMGCSHTDGYSFGPTGTEYRTVMSDSTFPGVRVPHFSNPDVTYDGHPTGVPLTADSAAVLNGAAPIVANFRHNGIQWLDCDGDNVPDSCEPDCNRNGTPDDCELNCTQSCPGDPPGIPSATDCNHNGIPDECDLVAGGTDCNGNSILDECEVSTDVHDASPQRPIPAVIGATIVHELVVSAKQLVTYRREIVVAGKATRRWHIHGYVEERQRSQRRRGPSIC
ncbi:MAG: hypothetical protein GY715_15445, partial [Planctomycetes bacterium]|nr:hypothetical protein [Planctomycetota bacterium]